MLLVILPFAFAQGNGETQIVEKPLLKEQSKVVGLENAQLRVRNQEQKQHLERVMNKITENQRDRLNQLEKLEFTLELVEVGEDVVQEVVDLMGGIATGEHIGFRILKNAQIVLKRCLSWDEPGNVEGIKLHMEFTEAVTYQPRPPGGIGTFQMYSKTFRENWKNLWERRIFAGLGGILTPNSIEVKRYGRVA